MKERRPQFCLHGTPAPLGTNFPLPLRGHTAGCSPTPHWPQRSQAGSQAQLLLRGFWNWDQAGRQPPEAAGERCKLGNLLVAMFYLITGTASRGRRAREVRDRRRTGGEQRGCERWGPMPSRGPVASLLRETTHIFSVSLHCTRTASSKPGMPQVQAFPESSLPWKGLATHS